MKKQDNKNLPVYIILGLLFIFQVVTFYFLRQEAEDRMKNYETAITHSMENRDKINAIEKKLNK